MPDSLPQISLGTAALAIFALCAVYVLLRGLTRMLMSTAVIAASAWLGFLVWQQAPELSVRTLGKSVPWLENGLPIAAFVVSFLAIRAIGKLLLAPFGGGSKSRPASFAGGLVRLVFALVPTSVIWLSGATLVHHAGAISEIRESTGSPQDSEKPDDLRAKLKTAVADIVPDSWLAWLDPLARPDRLALAKLIAFQEKPEREPVIDPETGKPYPRAIVVTDPALQNLAREGKYDTLLSHPELTKALDDPKIKRLLRGRIHR